MSRRIALRVFQAAVLVAVGWGVWRSLAPPLERLTLADFLRFRPALAPLLGSTGMVLLFYVSHAFLWRKIMSDLKIGKLSARETVRIYFTASLGRYLPGKLWQLAGLAVLAREAGLAAAPTAAAAVIGQVGFLSTGLLLLAILLPEWAGGLPAVLGAATLGLAAAGVWVLVATPLGRGARRVLSRAGGERMAPRLEAAFALADRIRPRAALLWFAGYGFSWILLGMAFTLFCGAFAPNAVLASRQLAGSLAASYLAGYIALVPAGIGVREGALATLLAGVPAISAAGAVVIALGSRIWFTVAELLPLALVPLLPPGSRDRGI